MNCSQRKIEDPSPVPAVDRYDGPLFRVLRRFAREQPDVRANTSIYIVSAKYGLVPGCTPILPYDQRMTPERVRELRPTVAGTLRELVRAHPVEEICVCVSSSYRPALAGWRTDEISATIVEIGGSIGKQQADLRDWLRQCHAAPATSAKVTGAARIRGRRLSYSSDQARQVARQALVEQRGHPFNFEAWYVELDNQRVAPKWFVSQLAELPVSAFSAQEARRVLAQLGIEVRRA